MAAKQNPITELVRAKVCDWLLSIQGKSFTLSDIAKDLGPKLKIVGLYDYEKPISNELIRRVDKGLLSAKIVTRRGGIGRPPNLYTQTEKALAR